MTTESVPEPTPSPSPKKKRTTSDSIEQLQKLLESMSDDDREKLERAGVYLPAGSLSAVQEEAFKWGVRCTHCNQVALFIVGDQWDVDGVHTDYPPPVPHHRIMWTQAQSPDQIDRATPKCQHCQAPVTLNRDGSFSRERNRIIRLDEYGDSRTPWQKQRDAAVKTGAKEARKLERGGAEVPGSLQFDRDYNQRDEPVSNVIARQHGDGAPAAIEAFAAATGADQFKARR